MVKLKAGHTQRKECASIAFLSSHAKVIWKQQIDDVKDFKMTKKVSG